jgi:hypothetical protein
MRCFSNKASFSIIRALQIVGLAATKEKSGPSQTRFAAASLACDVADFHQMKVELNLIQP